MLTPVKKRNVFCGLWITSNAQISNVIWSDEFPFPVLYGNVGCQQATLCWVRQANEALNPK